MPKKPSSASPVTKALTTDVLKRKSPLTVIGILFLTAALPILVAAVLYGVFIDSQASESEIIEKPMVLISTDPVKQPALCQEETCIPGALIFSIDNTHSQALALTPVIESPEGIPPGIEVELGYIDTNNPTGQVIILPPAAGGYAKITFTDTYVRDPSHPPVVHFSAYECTDNTNLDPNNYTIDAARCTYVGKISTPINWNGYQFRAFDYNRFALTGTYTQINASSMAIIDKLGQHYGPSANEEVKMTETVIEPNFRSLVELSWTDSETNQPASLKLYMQERGKVWEAELARFSYPSKGITDMPIPLFREGKYRSFIYQPSGVLVSPGGNAFISPEYSQLTDEPVLVFHDFQLTDLREETEPVYQRADIDQSGSIDIVDFSYWIAHFDTQFPDTSSPYDLTLDQRVGIFDYNLMIESMGKTVEYWRGQ